MDDEFPHWRANLYICLAGSFTTLLGMTLLLPFLPIYVAQLGARTPAAVVQWSGVAYGVTFLGAGAMAPVWGRLADRYGRKPILVRASFCMALSIAAIGLVHTVWQLVLLRFITGLLGGYASGATVLVATQTPRARAAWALGTLSVGVLGGNLLGPLAGGILPGLIGIRETFFLSGGLIFVAFLGTLLFVREDPRHIVRRGQKLPVAWRSLPGRGTVLAMLATATLLLVANMSIEPIITVFVAPLTHGRHVALAAGVVMSGAAFGSMLAAPRLGRLADRVGTRRVIVACLLACGVLLIPQAFVTALWQLVLLRFLMGLSLAGLLPAITATIRHAVPDRVAGTMLGYSVSAQYAGQVVGPVLGGFIGGHLGMRSVFLLTSAVMLGGAAFNWRGVRAAR